MLIMLVCTYNSGDDCPGEVLPGRVNSPKWKLETVMTQVIVRCMRCLYKGQRAPGCDNVLSCAVK